MAENLNILFIGDIVGEPGLNIVDNMLPKLIDKYSADLVICNGENADNGKGMKKEEANRVFNAGANVITTGNHIWDNWKSKPLLAESKFVIRPLNYPQGNVGLGFTFFTSAKGDTFAVLQLQGRTFMQTIDCPFKTAEFALKMIEERTNKIIVDFHADATAEKMAMGWFLDGKVSAIIGTHTHIQTNDASILPNGTAYITDVGMTGPYDSVVGMKKDIAIKRFRLQIPHKYEVAENDVKIAGVVVSIDALTGQAISIENFMLPAFQKSVFEGIMQ